MAGLFGAAVFMPGRFSDVLTETAIFFKCLFRRSRPGSAPSALWRGLWQLSKYVPPAERVFAAGAYVFLILSATQSRPTV